MQKILVFPFFLILFFCTLPNGKAQDWNQILKASASDREDKNTSGRSVEDYLGKAVAIFGDYAIISAPGEDEDENGGNYVSMSGTAYIFQKTNGEWKK